MKKKRIIIGLLVVLGIGIAVCAWGVLSIKINLLNYGDVAFEYGKSKNSVYYEFTSKNGLDINLNTLVIKNRRNSKGEVVASKTYVWVGGKSDLSQDKSTNYFEETLSNEQATVEWVFIFKDRTITVFNGETEK